MMTNQKAKALLSWLALHSFLLSLPPHTFDLTSNSPKMTSTWAAGFAFNKVKGRQRELSESTKEEKEKGMPACKQPASSALNFPPYLASLH